MRIGALRTLFGFPAWGGKEPVEQNKEIWSVSFSTNSREALIKAMVVLSSAIPGDIFDKKQRYPLLVIKSLGFFGKSLVADAILNALQNKPNPYYIPDSNKMSFEQVNSDAWSKPCINLLKLKGQFVTVSFHSYHEYEFSPYNIEAERLALKQTLSSQDGGLLIKSIGSLGDEKGAADIFIDITSPDKNNPYKDVWKKNWTIDIRDKRMQTPEMRHALDRLIQYEANKQKRVAGRRCAI